MWWTVFGDPEQVTDFRWALDELYKRRMPNERHDLTVPQGPMVAESWTAELQQGGWFAVEQVHFLRWSYALTADRARRLFGSFSNVMALAPEDRQTLLGEIGDLVDDAGGVVEDPYVTVALPRPPRRPDDADHRAGAAGAERDRVMVGARDVHLGRARQPMARVAGRVERHSPVEQAALGPQEHRRHRQAAGAAPSYA